METFTSSFRVSRFFTLLGLCLFGVSGFAQAGIIQPCVTNVNELNNAIAYWQSSQDTTVFIRLSVGNYQLTSPVIWQKTNGTTALVLDGGYEVMNGVPCGYRQSSANATVIDGNLASTVSIQANGSVAFGNLRITGMHAITGNGSVVIQGSSVSLADIIADNNFSNSAAIFLSAQTTALVSNSLFDSNIANDCSTDAQVPTCGSLNMTGGNTSYVINTTIANNFAAGLRTNSDVTVYNSIFWGNTTSAISARPYSGFGGGNIYIGYSDIHPASVDVVYASLGGNIDEDPLFTSASDFTLQSPSSPAINAGAPAGTSPYNYGTYDLAGNSRVIGSRIDIGPYESSFDDEHTIYVRNTNDTGTDSLRSALTTAQTGGPWHIRFALPDCNGAILLASPLPDVMTSVFIDGYSQTPGSSQNTSTTSFNATLCVSLLGQNIPYALRAVGSSSLTVDGLYFTNFQTAAIELNDGSNHLIAGNAFGARGPYPASVTAILVGAGATNTQIGGPFDLFTGDYNPADMNLIAGSANGINVTGAVGTTIAGNLFGTQADGSTSASNGYAINVSGVSSGSTIVQNNLINNSTLSGVELSGNAAHVLVRHNTFNGNATGVLVAGGANSNVIGAATGAPNILLSTVDLGNIFLVSNQASVWIQNDAGIGNSVIGNNFAVANTALPIDLAFLGPTLNATTSASTVNHLQHYPTISHASHMVGANWIEFALDGGAVSGNVQIDVYLSVSCESNGSSLRAGDGQRIATIIVPPLLAGMGGIVGSIDQWVRIPSTAFTKNVFISATATTSDNSTSELGACVPAYDDTPPAVGQTNPNPGDMVFRDDFGGAQTNVWTYN